jgi:hypothetical protein
MVMRDCCAEECALVLTILHMLRPSQPHLPKRAVGAEGVNLKDQVQRPLSVDPVLLQDAKRETQGRVAPLSDGDRK